MPAIMLLIGLSTTLTIFIGGMKLVKGDPSITVGNIAEFVIYVNMLTWPFASVGWSPPWCSMPQPACSGSTSSCTPGRPSAARPTIFQPCTAGSTSST
jgi:hypothetical protein